MWAIPHHGGLGGFIGMCYFSQMTWPVSFFVFQFPDHLHNSLMGPLYQPISLGVVGHGTQLLHAKEFAHLTNNVAHEVCPKDQDVTLIQKLANLPGHFQPWAVCLAAWSSLYW